ncbi:hypothetical protein GCM10019059_07960 [Camelimonas fluminis]|uniref:Uncharacterized protein n=1 Tax=Camelimonas fluminis TaxID=1576911 RepID=A0ABV7UFZ1_9HYPH|nr:hypothetical protein [Camelimonas fluminis]GHE51137.1 hypothetical protein GCM10019059_07960 [Camelimonas fluminis]
MAHTHDIAREIDAGLFEDWSEWSSLDADDPNSRFGLDTPNGTGGRVGRYTVWISPHHHASIIASKLPGASRMAGTRGSEGWRIPPEHWRALRAALPAIKDAQTAVMRAERAALARARAHAARRNQGI